MIPTLLFALAQTIPTSPGDYIKPSDVALRSPAYSVSGINITLDFKGVVLRGTPKTVDPDQRKGIGVRITGSNITIKNLTVAGYKVGILAENCKNLKLINCDVSWNWKQKLGSTPEKEDLNDWMSFHNNEKREWFRYGAGVYLDAVTGFEVKGLKAYGGQCGLMMSRSEKGLVWNSNINYMSAIGIGMYRSSNNRIMHNNLDYCVRGYSHGVYNRGQDSAAILAFEQCNKNVFAYNSARFGGDGFFLWAGQTTMDTGKGGCNDNLLYGNDFSDAPTNGIEATFSRNKFVNNRVDNCWHGFWTGYSYDTLIAGNHDCQGMKTELLMSTDKTSPSTPTSSWGTRMLYEYGPTRSKTQTGVIPKRAIRGAWGGRSRITPSVTPGSQWPAPRTFCSRVTTLSTHYLQLILHVKT